MVHINYRTVHLVSNKFFSTQKFGFIFYGSLYLIKDLRTCTLKVSEAQFPFRSQANQNWKMTIECTKNELKFWLHAPTIVLSM